MTSADTRERFDRYHKWFQTLLLKEFIELPLSEQERFIPIVEKFLKDCKLVSADSHSIKERRVQLRVTQVTEMENGDSVALGEVEGVLVRVAVPKGRIFKNGEKLNHILFSLDGETWYSSKRELITGR